MATPVRWHLGVCENLSFWEPMIVRFALGQRMRHDLRFIVEMRVLAGVTPSGPLSLFLSTSGNEGGFGLTTRLRF